MVSRHFTSVCMLTLIVNAILLGYISNGDRTLEAALPQNNSINRLQSSISNQSDDIKSIRNSTAAEVQVLKNIAQGFQITSTQIMFTTLTVFLLGVTLIIYGMAAWVAEKKDYHGKLDQGIPGEPVTGHYLQMVWRTTKEVGCGTGSGSTNTILVCRYSPAGNTPDVSNLPATESTQQQSNTTGSVPQQSSNAGSVPQNNTTGSVPQSNNAPTSQDPRN